MNELDNKIKYLLKKTDYTSFDVGMYKDPNSGSLGYVIGEYCTLHKGDDILTTDGKIITITQIDTCEVDSKWINWLRLIIGDDCFHLAKARVQYRNLIDWDEEEER